MLSCSRYQWGYFQSNNEPMQQLARKWGGGGGGGGIIGDYGILILVDGKLLTHNKNHYRRTIKGWSHTTFTAKTVQLDPYTLIARGGVAWHSSYLLSGQRANRDVVNSQWLKYRGVIQF